MLWSPPLPPSRSPPLPLSAARFSRAKKGDNNMGARGIIIRLARLIYYHLILIVTFLVLVYLTWWFNKISYYTTTFKRFIFNACTVKI